MLKKIIFTVVTALCAGAMAFAAVSVDVNKADQAALDGIRGIGPSLSNAILAERSKGGNFKDWQDLEKRVKGISDKNSLPFSKAGLVVNGQARQEGAPEAASAAKTPVGAPAKPASAGK